MLISGHVDAVLYLLDNEADVRLVDVNDMNALELATLGNKQDVAEAIIKYVFLISVITFLIYDGHLFLNLIYCKIVEIKTSYFSPPVMRLMESKRGPKPLQTPNTMGTRQ